MLKKAVRIIIYIILSIIGLVILLLFIFGFYIKNDDGTYSRWSGAVALFSEDVDFGYQKNLKKTFPLKGVDGPYIFGNKLYRVNIQNKLEEENIVSSDSILVQVANTDADSFYFKLRKQYPVYPAVYNMPQKLIAISDIEGNFNAFASFLQNNQIIDSQYNWIFGNGHLVLVGDFVDRGNNVLPVLWLIYKMEEQARQQQGAVHFILGNHELMNFQGKYKYNTEKYKSIAALLFQKNKKNHNGVTKQSDYCKFLYSANTELGKWLHSKNGIEKIGRYIFVHAGMHPDILKYKMSIPEMNEIARNNWDKDLYHHPGDNEKANFLLGRKGIFWYRGLVDKYKNYYSKITEPELDKILNYYNANTIVIGHTIAKDIVPAFNGKVICIDVHHGKQKNSGQTKGIFIENNTVYQINDKGEKVKL